MGVCLGLLSVWAGWPGLAGEESAEDRSMFVSATGSHEGTTFLSRPRRICLTSGYDVESDPVAAVTADALSGGLRRLGHRVVPEDEATHCLEFKFGTYDWGGLIFQHFLEIQLVPVDVLEREREHPRIAPLGPYQHRSTIKPGASTEAVWWAAATFGTEEENPGGPGADDAAALRVLEGMAQVMVDYLGKTGEWKVPLVPAEPATPELPATP